MTQSIQTFIPALPIPGVLNVGSLRTIITEFLELLNRHIQSYTYFLNTRTVHCKKKKRRKS